MAGSSFGNILKVTTFGESHGEGLGAVLDGFPAGMSLRQEDIQAYLDRRKPGTSTITTARKEADEVEILSGVFQGVTTGAPIGLLIRNTNQHSSDYSEMQTKYRPSHADYTFDAKYGFRDYRGGGRSSGRETAARVAAGAIAEKFLKDMGIDFLFYTAAIGDVMISGQNFNREFLESSPTQMPDKYATIPAMGLIEGLKAEQDSVGGMIRGVISGVPAGIGDPVFNKLDAQLSAALMSIGAVKEVGIGDGLFVAGSRGSENNDQYMEDENGNVVKRSNHGGGIYGGMTDGDDIMLSCAIKPTASISQPQKTIDRDGNLVDLQVIGRHDPCIVPRAVVVCETMSALTILDAMLMNMSARAKSVYSFYGKELPKMDGDQ